MMSRGTVCGAVAGVLGALLLPATAWAVDPTAPGFREVERVVAVVNSDVVLLSEVEEGLLPALGQLPRTLKPAERQKRIEELRREILDNLVADRLLKQQVDALGVDVSSDEVDHAINEVKKANGLDDTSFRQALAGQGMTMGQYREGLRKQLLRAKIINIKVRGRVNVSDHDLNSAVGRRMRTRKVEYRVHARHALFTLEADADPDTVEAQHQRALAFYKRSKAGEPWEKLAPTSDGPTQSGGDLGFFRRGDLMPEFEAVAFTTPPKTVARPLRSALGWHVVQVLERQSLDNRPVEQVKAELKEELMAEELERAFKRYISELRQQAHVEMRL